MREQQSKEAMEKLNAAIGEFMASSIDDPDVVGVGFTGAFFYKAGDNVYAVYTGFDGESDQTYDSLTMALIFSEAAMNVLNDIRQEEIMRAKSRTNQA